MLRVAVVDDDKTFAEELSSFIQKLADEIHENVEVQIYCEAVMFLEKYQAIFDIIFMDISMPYLNGIQAATKLRKIDERVALVFTTNFEKYALNGYSVSASGYLVKPFDYVSFKLKMLRLFQRLSMTKDRGFVIKIKNGVRRINVNSIFYIEVSGHFVIYHLWEELIESRSTLKELEIILSDEGFARCSEFYLVNLRYIDSFQKDSVCIRGEELKISRSYKKSFKEKFSRYLALGGGGDKK